MHPTTTVEHENGLLRQVQGDPAAVRIDVRHDPLHPVVRVSGELDIASAPLLAAMLHHVRHRHSAGQSWSRGAPAADVPVPVDVDLSQVTFADSHGLAPVMGSTANVVAASAGVRRVLHLLRQHETLPTSVGPAAPPTDASSSASRTRQQPPAAMVRHRRRAQRVLSIATRTSMTSLPRPVGHEPREGHG